MVVLKLEGVFAKSADNFKIKPTGTCFTDAFEEFERLMVENTRRIVTNEYRLAHGILKHPIGALYSHAWLETSTEVIDFGIVDGGQYDGHICRYAAAKEDYYKEKAVIERTLYSWHEAIAHNHASNYLGPWLPRYLGLCRNVRKDV